MAITENEVIELINKASSFLNDNQPDKAIDVLRSKESVNDHRLCGLLAKAYFKRGDTKGDIYSCHFFCKRAISLGAKDNEIMVMLAMSAFRKECYQEAAGVFSSFVTETSKPATRFLYGLSLMYLGNISDGEKWVKKVIDDYPDNHNFTNALKEFKSRAKKPLRNPETKPSALTAWDGYAKNSRDLYWLSKNIPCQDACPANTDIPEYLRAIYEADYDRAYRINLMDNIFPGVLGRVCARPCEGKCRHGWDGLGEPVAICFSKRSAADLRSEKLVVLEPLYKPTGYKVAVVGSGVAGLAVARNLALLGHKVTVYEKHIRPGGMMNQGIPVFRLPREIIDNEIEQVKRLGIEIICGVNIGVDLPLISLINDNDAVVLAAGTLLPNNLDLDGKDLKGIRHGLDFLLDLNENGRVDIGKRVVVIGGGFTAMDCARAAKRLGVESVKVCYRRSKNEMLVTPGELEELDYEGISVEYMVNPVAYVGGGGKITKLRFIRTQLGEPDSSGRRKPVPIAGSEFEMDVDTVLLATGQFPDTSWIDKELSADLVGDDKWLLSGSSQKTKINKLFVAGDFATGAKSLIEAIGHAKECALQVDESLTGNRRVVKKAYIQNVAKTGRIREMDYVNRQVMPSIAITERTLEAEVETGYDKNLASEETQRCYLCHFKFEIDHDRCIYCDWCVKAKPRPDCIVKVKSLVYDNENRIIGFERSKGSEDTKLIYINQEDCIRCGYCVDACPVDCISIQKVNLISCHDGNGSV